MGWSGWASSHFFRVCWKRSTLPWVCGSFGWPFFWVMPCSRSSCSRWLRPPLPPAKRVVNTRPFSVSVAADGVLGEALSRLCEQRWLDHCAQYRVDREVDLYLHGGEQSIEEAFELLALIAGPTEDYCASAHNIAGWYDQARETFLDLARPLTVDVADRATYGEHYPPAASRTDDDLRRASKSSRASLLNAAMTVARQQHVLALVQYERFHHILSGALGRCAVECPWPVGFDRGQPTSLLVVEWSADSGVAHCYPTLDADARRLGTVLRPPES